MADEERVPMDTLKALRSQAEATLLRQVQELAEAGAVGPALQAAEAYAWVISPSNSHGGDVAS